MGRPIEFIDLRTVGSDLLGQILEHGLHPRGSSATQGDLLFRHLWMRPTSRLTRDGYGQSEEGIDRAVIERS